MRKLLSLLPALLITMVAISQAPNMINYQGVARRSNGQPIDEENISIRLTIRNTTATGPIVYQEKRTLMTNEFGLFTIAIGSPGATGVIGSVATIDWGSGPKYLQVEMDPNGGSSFVNMGTTQLLSVPYALYSGSGLPVGPAGGDLTGTYPNPTVARIRGVNVNPVAPVLGNVLRFDGVNWSPSSLITATSLVLPYKDSAASNTDNIFHIIQTSPSSTTGALFGETRSTSLNGFGAGGSSQFGVGVRGISNFYRGVYGSSNTNSGVFGLSSSGAGFLAGVFGFANAFGGNGTFGYANQGLGFGAIGISELSTGVYGQTNAPTFAATSNDGAALYGLATSGGMGLYSNSALGISARLENTNPGNGSRVLEVLGNGTGVLSRLQNTNASNFQTTLEVISNGTGRAIVGRSEMPGFVNGGVIDGLTTTFGGNAVFGRATRPFAWGVYGLSDSSAGVAGIGFRPGSVGVLGQGWGGTAGQFIIDNTNLNTSNVLEVSNTQSGSGIVVNLNNSARAIDLNQDGNGLALRANSNLGVAARIENTNAANFNTTMEVITNGTGRAIVARSNIPGPVFGGVVDALTTVFGSNAYFARATKPLGWGVASLSDSSVAVGGIGIRPGSVGIYGQGYSGVAGQFVIDNTLANTSNVVEVSNSQGGSGVVVNLNNSARGIDVSQDGNGIGIRSNSNLGVSGRFENTNASNFATTLEAITNGNGAAIVARSNIPGPVFGGVVDARTFVFGSNAYFAHATRPQGWGVAAVSDSSVGIGGIGYRPGSVGVFGQGWSGTAGRFTIDNSFVNTSNVLEVSGTQSGNGVVVTVNNTARGISVDQNGSGLGVFSNSNTGTSGYFENTNAANGAVTLQAISNGLGRAIVGRSQMPGFVNGGVIDALSTTVGGNALFGRGTRPNGWGVYGLADSSVGVSGIGWWPTSVGVQGQSYAGVSAKFLIDNTLANNNPVVVITNTQTGNGLNVSLSNAGSGGSAINTFTNGTGTALSAFSSNGYGVLGGSNNSFFQAGVLGYNGSSVNGIGVGGYVARTGGVAVSAFSDSSIGVVSTTNQNIAGYFNTYGSNTFSPGLVNDYGGLGNGATFSSYNFSNINDVVVINRSGAGRGLVVSGLPFNNPMNFYAPAAMGKANVDINARSGLGLYSRATGTFQHPSLHRVAVGVYGEADSSGSHYNYGIVGTAGGGTIESAGVFGWIDNTANGTVNTAIYGINYSPAANRYAGLFGGNVQVNGTLSKAAGSFKIDHPVDPENKYLVHSFVESPDMMNVYNGNIVTDASGRAIVDLPSYFEAENIDFKYQLTVIGQFAQAIIGEEIKNNQFVIMTDKPNVKVSWQVTGIRNDKYAQQNRIVPELEKSASDKGRYLHPELYGQPMENGIGVLKHAGPRYSQSAKTNTSDNKASLQQDMAIEQARRVSEQVRNATRTQMNQLNQDANRLNNQHVDNKSNQLFGKNPTDEQKITPSTENNQTTVSPTEEKVKLMINATSQANTEKIKVTEDKPTINSQPQTQKAKQMLDAADKADATTEKKDDSKPKVNATNEEKVKKLNADKEKIETVPVKEEAQKTSPVEAKKLNRQ